MSDMGWRDKDDLDLTSEDIAAMAAEGQQLPVRGPGEKVVTGHSQWGFDVHSGQKIRVENLQIIERQGVTVTR